MLDPDRQVQESLHLFFRTFRRAGSASATVKAFHEQGLSFPRRLRKGPRKGELIWGELYHFRALQILHNPRYAGAFFFGRTHIRRKVDGKQSTELLPKEEWHALFPRAHEGYISWEEYEDNQRRLRELAQAHGSDRRKSPAREGPALLQGLVMCGVCGRRMTVAYAQRSDGLAPIYLCQREGIQRGERTCQRIPGREIDKAVEDLLLESITPLTLEVALQVQQELESRLREAECLRQQQVERARYEAELARRRYMHVDPENRLVADTLEAEWNEKLRGLAQAQESYERQCQADRLRLNAQQREQILSLATDFPRLWRNPRTPHRERKRMIRLLLEDVTLIKNKQITVHVRFKGGATRTVILPLPQAAWKLWQTPPEILALIDRLLDHCTDRQIASTLNERGLRSGKGLPFHAHTVWQIRHAHGLKDRYVRLREQGMLTIAEIAQKAGVTKSTIRRWRDHGLLTAHPYNEKNECLFELSPGQLPMKRQGQKLSERLLEPGVLSHATKEVQYEA